MEYFGYTGGSKVEIENSYNDGIINGNYYTGGIVGRGSYVTGECKINNCYNKNQITSPSTPTGGIIGTGNQYWKIQNCYNSGDITASNASISQVGGISGSSCGEINKCYNTGTISGSSNGYCGGIQGYMESSSTIKNCYNIGEIKSKGSTGGIIGRNAGSSIIKNCYSIGRQSRGGGISGWNQSSKIYNCFWLDTVATSLLGSGTNSIAKSSDQMKEAAFIDLLETENEEPVWRQDTTNMNRGYPILKWQMEE